jgi:hypothetical protein
LASAQPLFWLETLVDFDIRNSLWTLLQLLRPFYQSRLLILIDHLNGRVIRIENDGRVLMDFSQFKALTEVPIKVSVGQTLPLEIVKTGNPLTMRIVYPKAPLLDQIQSQATQHSSSVFSPKLMQQITFDLKILDNALTDIKATAVTNTNIQSALKALETLFAGLDLNSDSKTLAADIQTLIENSGLFYEKRVAMILENLLNGSIDMQGLQGEIRALIHSDFKPNAHFLLEFLNTLDQEALDLDETAKKRLQSALKEMLTDLQQQQKLAVKRFSSDDPLQIFQLSLPFQEKREAIKLKFYFTKKQARDSQSHPRISLLLDLKHLGLVRSDFLLIQRDLAVTFYVGSADIKEYFETQMEPVKKVLEDLFDTVALTVRVSEQKIKAFDGLSFEIDHDHKLDVRI